MAIARSSMVYAEAARLQERRENVVKVCLLTVVENLFCSKK